MVTIAESARLIVSLLVLREQGIDKGELKHKQECKIISGTVCCSVVLY